MFKIDRSVPIPIKKEVSKMMFTTMDALEVGDSFKLDNSCHSSIYYTLKKAFVDKEFTIRFIWDDKDYYCRIWRTK